MSMRISASPSSAEEVPQIAFLGHDMPWPTITGGRMRDAQLLPRACSRALVELFVVAPDADNELARATFPVLPRLTIHLFADESQSGIAPERSSAAAQEALRKFASERMVHAVHVEGHYLLHLIPAALLSRTVLVEHNVESLLLEQRRAVGERISPADIGALRRREESAWRAAGQVVVLTQEDAVEIQQRAPGVPLRIIPNGWDHLPARSDDPPAADDICRPRLLFLANHAYWPNRDALAWLLSDVMPRVWRGLPEARLVIAGANLTETMRSAVARQLGVEVVGQVPCSADAIDAADIVLCPLRIGGGIKVKMIESIRRAAAIVSTSVGAQGVPEPFREAICLANDAESFAAHVIRLCRDGGERRIRRERLWRAQNAIPTWNAVANEMLSLWEQVALKSA